MTPTSEYEVCGWHFATRQPVRLSCAGGKIKRVGLAKPAPALNTWIAPGLFDLQVNGFCGVDFQKDGLTVEHLLTAVRGLRTAGCTRFLLTLITDDWGRLLQRLRHLRALRQQCAELQRAIVGWHVEGPFLSAQPGFHGAHNPSLMRDPSPDAVRELRAVTETDPVLLTLSPERAGSLSAISLAVSLGMRVSLGHTNASAEVLCGAVAAGATAFTHLGNGCPRELDRHDNILWRVLETPRLMVTLIPDEIHVSSSLFRLFHTVLRPDSVGYVSDAMSAAGAPPGRYTLGALTLEVGADQVVRQPGKTLFAGSALRPIDGVFRAARMLSCDWRQAWARFSMAPARLMGLANELRAGAPADFCVIKIGDNGQLLKCLPGETLPDCLD